MNSEDEERIASLEERINGLESAVHGLEHEVNRVLDSFSKSLDSSKGMNMQPGPQLETTESMWAGLEGKEGPQASNANVDNAPSVQERAGKEDWELRFGKVWMPRIFVVVLLIGVVWSFLAAAKAGWLSRPVRIGIGYVAFVGLVTYGEIQMRNRREALGQVLLGAATAMAVMTTFAASSLYGYVPPTPAFILNAAFAVCGVLFSYRHKSEALGVVSVVAAVLVPFLVRSSHSNLTVFVAYESIASIAFALFSLKRGYRYLLSISLIAMHISFIPLVVSRGVTSEKFVLPAIIQGVLLFATALYRDVKSASKSSFGLHIASWLSLGLSTLWVYAEMRTPWIHAYLWVVSVVLFGVALAGWKRRSGTLLLGLFPLWPFLLLAFHSVESHEAFYWTFVLISTVAFVVGAKSRNVMAESEGVILFAIAGIVLLRVYNVFVSHDAPLVEHFTWTLFTAVTFVLAYPLFPKDWTRWRNSGVWFGIVVLGLYLTHESQVNTFSKSPNLQHMTLTFVWILYALGSIAFGVWKNNSLYRRFGTVFLFVTLSKLVLVDIPAVTLFVRAILFIALGGVGVLASRVFYRRK